MIVIPTEPPISEYLYRKASQRLIPISGTFELTPVCNMSCKMCYVRMTRQEQEAIRPLRTAEEWLALAEEAKQRGMLYLLLTGGEPFLHPGIRTIVEGVNKLGMVLSMNSNATMITEQTVAWLKNCPPARINVTLYGASDETYARLCNNPNGFTQAMRGINLLREAGIPVKINCSVTPYNVCDLEKIIKYCQDNMLIASPTAYMFPPMRRDAGMVGRNERFEPEEAAYYTAKIEQLLNGDERFLEKLAEQGEDYLTMPIDPGEDCLEIDGSRTRCRAGKCSFWVNWDGGIHACGMIPAEGCPNVFDIGFDAGWQKTIDAMNAVRLPAACVNCPAIDRCRPCAAMTMTETGSFHKIPEYRCRLSRAFPDACLKIKEEILAGRGKADK